MTKNMICSFDKTLLDVLQIINKNAKGAVFIVDNSEKLIGILTDGDIRRLLIDGHPLTSIAKDVVNKNFVSVSEDESPDQILLKIDQKIKILPVVNRDSHVIDFIEFKSEINIPVASPDLNGNELKYLMDAFLSTWISSSGKYITTFEENFATFCESKYGIAVSNGTVAIHLALKALDIGAGDEVIIPDFTFAATINAVLQTGATPVLVDIEADSWCIDPKQIEKAITPKTKAIIPVHIYGQPSDMDSIMAISKKHHLFVIEDCAEAHGARFDGKKVGSFGDISCFSFFGNKIITTGEGGMCITNSNKLNEKMRILRDHGMSKEKKYWHSYVGFNYRMTNLQASIGCAQLERIDAILAFRNNVEKAYSKILEDLGLVEFQKANLPKREKITWLTCVLIKGERRDEVLDVLHSKKIDARPFFYALSEMDIYKQYQFSNKNSLNISRKGINLPTHFAITDNEIQRVSDELHKII